MTTQLIPSTDLDTSPIQWTVDQVIPRTGTGYAWGPPGSGKSLAFGVELGLAVSSGRDWFGHPVIRGPVVYCLGEGLPGTGIRKQARLARQQHDDDQAIGNMARDHGDAAARALSASLPDYSGDQLFILCQPFDIRLTPKGEISASMREAITVIRAQVEAPELVICDAAGDFTGGADLSSPSNANKYAAGLKALANELDCVCVIIAHPVKKGDAMLGGGRLVAAADFCIEVQPDERSAPGSPMTASVMSRKSKDSSKFPDFGYELCPATWQQAEEDEDGQPTGRMVTVESATVRLLEAAPVQPPGPRSRPAAPLPVLTDTPHAARPSKRSGIKRHGLHAVPDAAPGSLAALAASADARREITRLVLAAHCPVCSRSQLGCDQRMGGSALMLLGRSLSGPLYVHQDRALTAALAQPDPDAFLDTVLAPVA